MISFSKSSSGLGAAEAGAAAPDASGEAGTTSPTALSRWSKARTSMMAYRHLGGLTTSYFLEKQAVVIDFGQAFTKVGFASEARPRHILPSPELRRRGWSSDSLTVAASEKEWIDLLDKLLNRIFFYYLSVSPKDRRVVVCDAVYASEPFRNALAHVLFKRLAAPCISFVADLVLPLYLTGLSSGIVIDIGYSSTRVLATYAGVPVVSAFQTATPGARHVISSLRRSLEKNLSPQEATVAAVWLPDEAILQDLLVSGCYVSCEIPLEAAGDVARLEAANSIRFCPSKGHAVTVPYDCRRQPAEVFFKGVDEEDQADGPHEGCDCEVVPEAFAQALERCPIDVRAVVVQNIVVVGGCATMRGLLPRLAMELRDALRASPKSASLADRLRFTPLDFAPVCATWTGGAVYSSLEGVAEYREKSYTAGHPTPSWARDGFV